MHTPRVYLYVCTRIWNAFPTEWTQGMPAIRKGFCHQIFVILIAWNNNLVLHFGQFYSNFNCAITVRPLPLLYQQCRSNCHVQNTHTHTRVEICLIASTRYESMCSHFARMKRLMWKWNKYVPKIRVLLVFYAAHIFIGWEKNNIGEK